jgi:hypothetical protein
VEKAQSGEARSGDDLVSAFTRWVAAERVQDAADRRSQERRMAEAASVGATLAGVLVDLAESAQPVVLVVGARRLTCTVVGVAADFCVIQSERAPAALVALRALGAIWPDSKLRRAAAGDRSAPLRLSFAAALAAIAEERLPVALWCGPDRVEGDLLAVGDDVATLRTFPPSRRLAHLPLAAITMCELR